MSKKTSTPEVTPEATPIEAEEPTNNGYDIENVAKQVAQLAYQQGSAETDYIRKLAGNQKDLDFIKDYLAKVGLPQNLQDLIEYNPRPEAPGINIVMQSEIERDWLKKHFDDKGLFGWLDGQNSPIMLGLKEMKDLYIREGLEAIANPIKRI